MRDARAMTLHFFVTYRGIHGLLGSLLVLTAFMGCFASFSAVHNLALLGPLKCLDFGHTHGSIFGTHLHLHGADADHQHAIQEEEVNAYDSKDDYKPDPIDTDLLNSTDNYQEKDDYDVELFNSTPRYVYAKDNAMRRPRANSLSFNPSSCTKSGALLKVYMYDLHPEFHFGMIEPTEAQSGRVWPKNLSQLVQYPGGLYEQHSPEYWLTLDLLLNTEQDSLDDGSMSKERPCGAYRVKEAKEADVFFVPFFSSLSYNKYRLRARNGELQRKLVDFLVNQEPWKLSKGRDHVVMMHHPNSLHVVRQHLKSAIFVVADFGRYHPRVANVGKDVVAPYKHIIPSFEEDNSTFASRPNLLFFQGVIIRKQGGIIRQRLFNILKDEKGVSFRHGSVRREGMSGATTGMRSSKFCLHLAGDTPSSNRLFDAIASHCVPVIVSKNIELPYEGLIDYAQFCIFVNPSDALKKGFLVEFLRSIGKEEWTRMWRNLKSFQHRIEYQFPSRAEDAVQMIWKSISLKTPSIKQAKHRAQRYSRSYAFKGI